MNKKIIFIGIFLFFFFYSCNNGKSRNEEKEATVYDKEVLVKVNKGLVEKYSGIIESYVTRRGWPMEETKTGLWYMIYEKGQGEMTGKGKYATINYTVHLLDGTFCYSSDSLGAKTFKIGQGGVEPGLEQGILLMKEGDKAKFILPPYIGHGLLGDSKKIPRLAVIIYDVELLEVSCRQN